MRKTGLLGLALAALLAVGCSTRIEPGHVGIVVNYSGTDRGVDSYPIRTGRVWYNPYSERVIEYPVFVQTAKWTASTAEGKAVDESVTFTNRDGMQFAADISLSYHLVSETVPAFYVKFRSEDLEGFTHNFLRNVARDKFAFTLTRFTVPAAPTGLDSQRAPGLRNDMTALEGCELRLARQRELYLWCVP
jgi:hypothetical protein